MDTLSGQVFGRAVPRHTSADFLAFLSELVDQQPRSKEIHVILDNLSAHKTKAVASIDRVYPLDQAAEAQRRVVEDRPFGRVFLDPQT